MSQSKRRARRGKGKSSPAHNQSELQKSTDQSVSRLRKSPVGTEGLAVVSSMVESLKPFELTWSRRLFTFEDMCRDDAVSAALDLNYVLVEEAFDAWRVKENPRSAESKKAAEFLRYSFNNMENQSMRQFARSAITFKKYGFSVSEKIYDKVKSGKYEGMWKLQRLSERPQISVNMSLPFLYEGGGRKITACLQNPAYLMNSPMGGVQPIPSLGRTGCLEIPRNKFLMFGYNATDSRPLGQSPLENCYTAWREKVLLNEYTMIGVSKDFSGTPIIYIPRDILDRAARDPDSEEALYVETLKKNAANMHTGDQNYLIMPSDTFNEQGSGVREFDIRLVGIEGSGKQFDTLALVEQKNKAIFKVFGAVNLNTGETGGSYNRMEGENSLHMHFINRDIAVIEEQINGDLIPQLLALNGIHLDREDIPKFSAGEVEPLSSDEASKMLQRAKAVNGVAMTKDIIIQWHEMLGFNVDSLLDKTEKDLQKLMNPEGDTAQTRSGDGMKAGLNNSTSNTTATDTTASNKEHN